jgi:hypothetical protein
MIDLMALAEVEMETEVTYIRRERDWATRAAAEGRILDPGRLLPVLPASIAEQIAAGAGNGHGNGHGNGNGHAHGDGHNHGAAGGHAGHG